MRLFYDFRSTDFTNPKKYPLQGYVLLKTKKFWLCWIYKDPQYRMIKGFIVTPKSIYFHNIYIAKSFWDAFKYLFRQN